MRKMMIGGFVLAGLLGGTLAAGLRGAEASKPYTPVTKLACVKCHTSKSQKDMSDKDLTPCGKESYDVLKKGGYKPTKDAGEQKEWATKLLKDFKCK